jgi:hypothetical protein
MGESYDCIVLRTGGIEVRLKKLRQVTPLVVTRSSPPVGVVHQHSASILEFDQCRVGTAKWVKSELGQNLFSSLD